MLLITLKLFSRICTGATLVFFVGAFVLPQVASASVYQPGTTLEPDCPPTESLTTCGVVAPAEAGANTNITSLGGLTSALSVGQGGSGIASYTVGDLIYALSSSVLTKLGIGTDGQVLKVSGGVPVWGTSANANLSDTDLTLLGTRKLILDGHSFTLDGTGDTVFSDNGNASIGGSLTVTATSTFSGDFATPKGADYSTTGSQNNVNLGTGSLFRYTGGNTATFTGLAGGSDGKQIRIINASGFNLVLNNNDSSSLAANRILTSSGSNLTVPNNVSVGLQYDSGVPAWRVVVLPATSGTISGFAYVNGGNGFGAAATLGTTDAFGLDFITAGNTRFSLAAGAATLTGTGATTLTTDAGSALALDSGTTGALNIGTGANAKTITIGNSTGATVLNLNSGTGGINLTGLTTFGNASSTLLSALNKLYVGRTATSTIVGDNGLSTLKSDLLVTGSTTLQNFTAANSTTTNATSTNLYAAHLSGDGQNITLARIGNSTYSTLQDLQNVFHSAGYTSGGAVTDNGDGSVSVAAGTGLLRPTNSALSTIFYVDWVASSTIAIPTNSIRYIGIEYNNGSPQISVRTSSNWNLKTDFSLGVVVNENGVLNIYSDKQAVGDHAANMVQRDYESMPIEPDVRNGGLVFTETGTRNLLLSAGAVWDRLNRYVVPTINTSTTGNFDAYYMNGSGGFTKVTGLTQWPNTQYDDMDGTLATMTDNQYAVLWFYLDTNAKMSMVYGMAQYATAGLADAEMAPTIDMLPDRLKVFGKLIGKVVFQKSASSAANVESLISMSTGSMSSITSHASLTDLDYEHSGHTGFIASAGQQGGQIIVGATTTSDGLTFQSTSGNGSSDFIKFLVGNNGSTEAGRFSSAGDFSMNGLATFGHVLLTGSTTLQNFTGGNATTTGLAVSGLSSLSNLLLTGSTTLQNFTAVNATTTNATTTNLAVSAASQLGTVISGLWNGSAIGALFGGTGQTSWTKGDVLYASADNTLAKLPVGGAGTVLKVGVSGVPSWQTDTSGTILASQWATTTNSLALHPIDPTQVILVGASATTTAGNILEVTGNSLFTGSSNITGLATLSGGASTTNASLSGSVWVGGNATTTSSGAFTTNGLITAAGAGTGLSITNNASVGGLATIANLLMTGSTTLQNFTAVNSTTTSATTTNLFATNLSATNFSAGTFNSSNISTGGTLAATGLSTLSGGASTTNITASAALWVGGLATTTGGVVNTQTGFQIGGVNVLTGSTLGSGITGSSLTSVGTLSSLNVSGLTVLGNASTTNLSASNALWVGGLATTTNGIVNTQTKYQVAGADVLTGSALGSGITGSSLTSVGTLSSLNVSGLTVLGNASTTLLSASGGIFVGGNATTSASGNFATNGTITSGLINGQTVSSSANFTGSLTSAGLLTASNGLTLTTGSLTLPAASVADAALSSNVALLNRVGQTFASANTFSGLVTIASTTVTGTTTLSGDFATPKGTDYSTTGSQNNVSLGTGSLFRYTGASTATFTGIAGGTNGRQVRIMNLSSSNLTISHENAGSSATNRITSLTGADLVIVPNLSITLQYDSGTSRWLVVALPASASTVNSFAFVQSGNAFGATATLGTTDANGLNFITGGNTRFSLAAGASTFTGTGATALAGGSTLALTSAAGSDLTVTSGTTGNLTLDSGSSGGINIGTGSTAKIVTIGNGTGATSVVLNAGTGNIDIGANAFARTINVGTGAAVVETINVGGTGANVISVGNAQTGGSLSLGAAMTTGTISIGGTGAQTGNFDLAPSTAAETVTLANGTGAKTLNIGNGVSGNTISIGNGVNSSAQIINLGAGAAAANSTINILSGVATAGTQTLNLGTGASAKTINIGNTSGATALNLLAGTGGITLTGLATLSNASTTQLSVLNGVYFGATATSSFSSTGVLTLASALTVGNGGTGATSFGQGWIYSVGGSTALAASTSPTVNYLVATSTTASSTFSTGGLTVDTNKFVVQQTSGNVGVGNASPSRIFDVSGDWGGNVVTTSTVDSATLSTISTKALVYYVESSDTTGTCNSGTKTFNITGLSNTEGSHAFIVSKAIDAGCSSATLTLTVQINGSTISTVANANTNGTVTENYVVAYVNGAWRILGTPSTADGADLAETYSTNDESIEAGDVVSLDPSLISGVKKTSGVNDRGVVGIVSTMPAIVIGGMSNEGAVSLPVALSGRVPVKVNSENGAIVAGDYLTPSSVPGVAMKSGGTGPVIGQAMWSFDTGGTGMVLALIKNFDLGEISQTKVLLGDISNADGISTLLTTIQSETARNPVVIIGQKISDGEQFLTDFVVARVTALRGYFDEVFAKKVHTEQICVKKSDGSEVCVNGDQLQNIVNTSGGSSGNQSIPSLEPPSVDNPPPDETPAVVPDGSPPPALDPGASASEPPPDLVPTDASVSN